MAGLLLVDSRRVWAAPQDNAAASPVTSSEEGAIDDWPDQEAAESHRRHLFREGRRQQVGAGLTATLRGGLLVLTRVCQNPSTCCYGWLLL